MYLSLSFSLSLSMYIYIYDCKVSYRTLGPKSNVKVCDHKTIFPDTHRHFRPATKISRQCPIVCGSAELKNSNLKNETCLDTQPMNDTFELFGF